MVALPFEAQPWWTMRSRLCVESLYTIRSGMVVLRHQGKVNVSCPCNVEDTGRS